jgi:hypothetical protein
MLWVQVGKLGCWDAGEGHLQAGGRAEALPASNRLVRSSVAAHQAQLTANKQLAATATHLTPLPACSTFLPAPLPACLQVFIPYACKLLFQELMAMCIGGCWWRGGLVGVRAGAGAGGWVGGWVLWGAILKCEVFVNRQGWSGCSGMYVCLQVPRHWAGRQTEAAPAAELGLPPWPPPWSAAPRMMVD